MTDRAASWSGLISALMETHFRYYVMTSLSTNQLRGYFFILS